MDRLSAWLAAALLLTLIGVWKVSDAYYCGWLVTLAALFLGVANCGRLLKAVLRHAAPEVMSAHAALTALCIGTLCYAAPIHEWDPLIISPLILIFAVAAGVANGMVVVLRTLWRRRAIASELSTAPATPGKTP